MNISDVIQPITNHEEWLFKKMAGRFEGWAIKRDARSVDVPLNELDYFAVRVLANTIETSGKTVIAVPRTTPGLTLSLVSYLTVNRFISKEKKGLDAVALMFEGFRSIPIDEKTPVVVITKNRKLRDYYANSDITFGGHTFPFKNFPIYRIKRSGELTKLVRTSDNRRFKIAPVVFYHLDELETIPRSLEGSVVLIELDTLLSYSAVDRLNSFLKAINPTGVLAVTNTFATGNLLKFKKEGFGLVVLRPEMVLKYAGDESSFPSFASAMSEIPSLTEIHARHVQGQKIDLLISRLSTQLNKISQDLGNDVPPIFFAARTILTVLRNLSVPLDIYEIERKQSGYLKSIKFLIEKIFTNRYIDLTPNQESIILPIWGAIATDYFELYRQLLIENPKYLALSTAMNSEEYSEDSLILVFDNIQAKILRETLNNHQTEGESATINIQTVKDADRYGMRAQRIVLTGIWQAKDEAAVLCTMPDDIDIFTYSSEVLSLKSIIKRLQEIPLAEDSINTLVKLGFVIDPDASKPISPWILADEETSKAMSEARAYSEVAEPEEELPDFYYAEIEDISPIFSEESEDTRKIYYEIETDEGDIYKLDASKDVLAYSEGTKIVRSISPENLSEGDSVLALDNESNREIFQEVALRTKDLIGANVETLEQWENALSYIRRLRASDGERSLIIILKMLKCDKTETTMKQWFKGITLAPQNVEDVISLLRVANVSSAKDIAPKVCVEIEKVRKFHRRLGRRLHSKISNMAQGNETDTDNEIDMEIDEILDLTHLVKLERITGPVENTMSIKELLVLR